jgi:hypothetical protein
MSTQTDRQTEGGKKLSKNKTKTNKTQDKTK